MASISSPRDDNNVPCILITSSADGKTLLNPKIDPVTYALHVSDGTTGNQSGAVVNRDANFYPGWLAVSSVDGKTPVKVFGDPLTNALLIKST